MSADPKALARLVQVAGIVGPQSAAAKALADYERRMSAGEHVDIYEYGNRIIVGPALTALTGSAEA